MVTTCASVATWWPNLIPMLVCWRHLAVVYIEISIKFSKKKPWTIRPIVPLAMKTSAILEVKIIYLPSSIYKCDESTNEDDRSYPPNKWQIGTRKQLFDSSFFHLLASYFATATLRASSSTHTLHLKLYFHRDDSDKSKRNSILQYPITILKGRQANHQRHRAIDGKRWWATVRQRGSKAWRHINSSAPSPLWPAVLCADVENLPSLRFLKSCAVLNFV